MSATLRSYRPGGRVARGLVAPMRARLPSLIGFAGDAEELERRLAGGSWLQVGGGAVGRAAAAALARFRPRRVVVVDSKEARAESVLTGLLTGLHDVGRWKAELVAEDIFAVAPDAEVQVFTGAVQDLPLAAWLNVDAVVGCTDNPATEAFVGERCHQLALPLILANVHGGSVVAQVRMYSNQGPDSPCPGCGFGREEWAMVDREVGSSCDGSSAGLPGQAAPPTRSMAYLGAIAGSLVANQWLRSRLSLGAPVADSQLEFCGVTARCVTAPLGRRAGCRGDHGPSWERRTVAGDPGRWSFDGVGVAAGFEPGTPGLWVAVDGQGYLGMGHCRCSEVSGGEGGRPVHRYIPTGRGSIPCRRCGEAVRVAPFDRRLRVTAADLGDRRSWSLRRLGCGRRPVLLVGDGVRTVVLSEGATASDTAGVVSRALVEFRKPIL